MSSNPKRFGEIVEQRRLELELTQLEVQAAGGPSNTWQTLIENGRLENLTRVTAKRVDAGLRWEPGSARNVWNGGDPIPVADGRKAFAEDDLEKLRHYIGEADVDDALRDRLLEVLDKERGAAG